MRTLIWSALDMILLLIIMIISPVVAAVLMIISLINIILYEIKSKREETK